MIQHLIIFIVLALSLCYAGYRIYIALKSANNPCYGCKGCSIRKELEKNRKSPAKKSRCDIKSKEKIW